MRLLHEDGFEFILNLLPKVGQTIDIRASDEIRNFLNEHRIKDVFRQMEHAKLIKLNSARIDYLKGSFMEPTICTFWKVRSC